MWAKEQCMSIQLGLVADSYLIICPLTLTSPLSLLLQSMSPLALTVLVCEYICSDTLAFLLQEQISFCNVLEVPFNLWSHCSHILRPWQSSAVKFDLLPSENLIITLFTTTLAWDNWNNQNTEYLEYFCSPVSLPMEDFMGPCCTSRNGSCTTGNDLDGVGEKNVTVIGIEIRLLPFSGAAKSLGRKKN